MPFDERQTEWWPDEPEDGGSKTESTLFERMTIMVMMWPLTITTATVVAAAEGCQIVLKSTVAVLSGPDG
jgi:hypothetical protein